MSTPQDPFASPPSSSDGRPLSPGMLPGASVPPPQPEPEHHLHVSAGGPPTTLGLWATIATGALALLSLVSALGVRDSVEAQKDLLVSDEMPSLADSLGGDPLSLLSMPIQIASFVLLALWMFKTRTWRTDRGERVSGPPAVEWWGWFVPLAWFVLPYLGMRGITRGHVGVGLLLGWWLTYCSYWLISYGSAIPSFAAIDLTTGEVTNPDAFDMLIPLAWGSAIALIVSWAFLALVIRRSMRSMSRVA